MDRWTGDEYINRRWIEKQKMDRWTGAG